MCSSDLLNSIFLSELLNFTFIDLVFFAVVFARASMMTTETRPLTKPGSDCLDWIGSDSGSDRIGLRIGLVSSLLVQKNYFDKSCFNNDTGGSE